ncbi:jg21409 [Pararge aegeria aegeria]|uniref:Jg21409 protein n=1 Tax=Pararge aegeria aegeria TaxID=348720 RepID=A0A8S4QU42_9NEOP|nr:jg21409 [Pararge aegeria aegeria]
MITNNVMYMCHAMHMADQNTVVTTPPHPEVIIRGDSGNNDGQRAVASSVLLLPLTAIPNLSPAVIMMNKLSDIDY